MDLKDDTISLIKSLERTGVLLEQIIIVDNGSKDGSVSAIQNLFGSHINIIENMQNMGFSGGNNQGFARALELGAEWVLLLNNDTIVAPNFLDSIIDVLSINHLYSILSPAIFHYSDPESIWHFGANQIPGTLLGRNLYQGQKLPKNLPPLLPVDFISGCAMLIHISVYQEVGLFDECFFAYWEEVDFCYRARKAGFHIAVMPQARIWHKVAQTAKKDTRFRRYLITRNMIYYSRKNAQGLQKVIMATYLFFRFSFTLCKDIASGQRDLIPPLYEGWKDGWNE